MLFYWSRASIVLLCSFNTSLKHSLHFFSLPDTYRLLNLYPYFVRHSSCTQSFVFFGKNFLQHYSSFIPLLFLVFLPRIAFSIFYTLAWPFFTSLKNLPCCFLILSPFNTNLDLFLFSNVHHFSFLDFFFL